MSGILVDQPILLAGKKIPILADAARGTNWYSGYAKEKTSILLRTWGRAIGTITGLITFKSLIPDLKGLPVELPE